MTVTEVHMKAGNFTVPLIPDTPLTVRSQCRADRFSRALIVITPVPVDPIEVGDAGMLAASRYTGLLMEQPDEFTLAGVGMNHMLATRSVGSPGLPGTGTFGDWYDFLQMPGLTAGVESSIPGTYTTVPEKTFFTEIADIIAARFGAEYRISHQLTWDFGTPAAMNRTTPTAVITRRDSDGGRDMNLLGIVGRTELERSTQDLRRRVVYHYDGVGSPIFEAGGVSDANFPFRDPGGGPAFIDEIIDDQSTSNATEAAALALAAFNRVRNPRIAVTLDSTEYDIAGDVRIGDPVWVYDPSRMIEDLGNPRPFRDDTIYPEAIRVMSYTWPIRAGFGCYLRRWIKPSTTWVLDWVDLSPWLMPETGSTSVEVGAVPRSLRLR